MPINGILIMTYEAEREEKQLEESWTVISLFCILSRYAAYID
jgi:hypothetical protein